MIIDPGPFSPWAPGTDATLDEIAELGADTVRLRVEWDWVAPRDEPDGFDASDPADPSYDFAWVDGFMRAAHKRDISIYLQVGGPSPTWAGDHGNGRSPQPADFGEFMQAISTRYGGAFVPARADAPLPAPEFWSVWNEPNLPMELQPQFRDGVPYSPILYRRLYLAAQSAILANSPNASILFGETAPYGHDGDSLAPVAFLRGALCIADYARTSDACGSGAINSAGWSTHPYGNADRPPFVAPPDPNQISMANLDLLEEALGAAARGGMTAGRLPVYLTESGYQSPSWVSEKTQAEYLPLSEWIAQTDPEIRSMSQYLIRDDAPPLCSVYCFQTGLRYSNGVAKPAYNAFRIPLVVRRTGNWVSIWGMVRPARSAVSVSLERRGPDHVPQALAELTSGQDGIVTFESDYVDGDEWRLIWHAPGGAAIAGAWTSAYAF